MKKTATKKKEGTAMKTNKGGSVTVDKEGEASKTVTKKKAKPKPKDTTDEKVNENVD